MYQLELVFQLLVRLQFMYFQYNVYLSIVVRTNIVFFYIHAHDPKQINLRTPQLAGFACQLGCKNLQVILPEAHLFIQEVGVLTSLIQEEQVLKTIAIETLIMMQVLEVVKVPLQAEGTAATVTEDVV